MAVTVGNLVSTTGAASTTLTSPSIDASAGANQCLIVGTSNSSATAQNATGVTWDVGTPENFTAQGSINALSFYGCDQWSLIGFTQATDTVTATWSSAPDDMAVYCREYEGVDQTTPVGNTQTDSDASGSVSVTLTSVDTGDMCVDCYGADNRGGTAETEGADQTERVDIASSGSYPMGLCMSEQDGADGGVMTYTNTNTLEAVYAALVLNATATCRSMPPATFAGRQTTRPPIQCWSLFSG